MINIKILGSGCANWKRLEAVTCKVVDSLGLKTEIEKGTDYGEIMKYPILTTPGLVSKGQAVPAGRLLSEAQIAQ